LDIPCDRERLEPRILPPKPSFRQGGSREAFFSSGQKLWIRLLSSAMQLVPYALCHYWANRTWQRPGPIFPGTFSNVSAEYGVPKRWKDDDSG
jgi:hypothetical protein